ncbi:MAG: HIT family protein [Phycisphaerales bacterium]
MTTPKPDANSPASLQAPWRLEYLESLGAKESEKAVGSFLRAYFLEPSRDIENHVVARTADTIVDSVSRRDGGMILLNAFPYANGHLLVALGEARATLLDYDEAQRAALWRLVERAADLMRRTLQPQGLNIGINEGRAAGAGVPDHLHVHLVPRWGGDVNFMTVVGQVRVIPAALEAMARRYRDEMAK